MARLKRSTSETPTPKPTSSPEPVPFPVPETRPVQATARRIELATAQVDDALERIRERAEAQKKQAKADAEKGVKSRVDTLSPRERIFLINHLAGETQIKAAEIAGYSHPEKQGWRLAHSTKIRAAMDEILTAQQMGKLELIARLSEQARNVQADYIKPSGRVDLEAMIRDGKQHLIKGVTPTQWGPRVEFMPAYESQVQMGRYHGLFTDNVNSSGSVEVGVKESTVDKLARLAGILDKGKERRDGAAASEESNNEQ